MHENVLTVHGSHTIAEIVRVVLQTFSECTECQWLKEVLWKCHPQQRLFFKTGTELGLQSVRLLERKAEIASPCQFPQSASMIERSCVSPPDDARKSIEKLISVQGF